MNLLRLSAAACAAASLLSFPATAHEPHTCPPGLADAPVIPGHVEQTDIAMGDYSFEDLFEIGEELFSANWNTCDGQGRPATTGTGAKRVAIQPNFHRVSGADSNSCAGCHNAPRVGGAGDFVANVFVLGQAADPVQDSVNGAFSNERNTLGMFGGGAIDMLAREMTRDLQAQAAVLGNGAHTLVTKGVEFEIEISGGQVVASRGVDTDLIVKPFHQAGVVHSLREFTVNAMNHHHGMQAEERFDLNPDKAENDYDEDGVRRELTVGDITATTLFQAALGVPGRLLPKDRRERAEVERGEVKFAEAECTSCHIPELHLESRDYVEPYSLNPPGTFSDTTQPYVFDMTEVGEGPLLERARGGGAVVRAYTDLKRHNLCDPETDQDPIRHFCNEQLAQGRPDQDDRPGTEFFLTRKLWDVGNSAPYGHRGDLTTITEAILAHGGEARASRDAFDRMGQRDRAAIVAFLRSLQVLPPGSDPVEVASSPR